MIGEKIRFYFDTSIWLDFLEDRDEPNMPKSIWAKQLVQTIVVNKDIIIFSDNNSLELETLGYSSYELEQLLSLLAPILIYAESKPEQIKKARDLSEKRDVPKRDALHSLIARDNCAILVSLDHHFQRLKDITEPHNPKEFI